MGLDTQQPSQAGYLKKFARELWLHPASSWKNLIKGSSVRKNSPITRTLTTNKRWLAPEFSHLDHQTAPTKSWTAAVFGVAFEKKAYNSCKTASTSLAIGTFSIADGAHAHLCTTQWKPRQNRSLTSNFEAALLYARSSLTHHRMQTQRVLTTQHQILQILTASLETLLQRCHHEATSVSQTRSESQLTSRTWQKTIKHPVRPMNTDSSIMTGDGLGWIYFSFSFHVIMLVVRSVRPHVSLSVCVLYY